MLNGNAWHPLREMNCESSKRTNIKSCLLWCKTAMRCTSHSLTQPFMMNVSTSQWELVF